MFFIQAVPFEFNYSQSQQAGGGGGGGGEQEQQIPNARRKSSRLPLIRSKARRRPKRQPLKR